MRVYCYPQDGKPKSMAICRAFAEGCGGEVVTDGVWRPGHTMFYGISDSNAGVWATCRQHPEFDWYYADNAYFDQVRGSFFRVAKNRLQHPGTGRSDGTRFRALGIGIAPWRRGGTHVLVTPQSAHFMRVAAGYCGDWAADAVTAIGLFTDRPVIVRPWNRDKMKLARELPDQLRDAWALVTYSSASAITALMMGVPAVCTATDCVVEPMAIRMQDIEDPVLPVGREDWAAVVADQQWTIEEFRTGRAWADLQR